MDDLNKANLRDLMDMDITSVNGDKSWKFLDDMMMGT